MVIDAGGPLKGRVEANGLKAKRQRLNKDGKVVSYTILLTKWIPQGEKQPTHP